MGLVSLVLASMMVALAPCNGNRDKNKTQGVHTRGHDQTEDQPCVDPSDMEKLLKELRQQFGKREGDHDVAMNILLGNSWAENAEQIRIIDKGGSEVAFETPDQIGTTKYRNVTDLLLALEAKPAKSYSDDLYLVIPNNKMVEAIRNKCNVNAGLTLEYLLEDQHNAKACNGMKLRRAYTFAVDKKTKRLTFDDSQSDVFQATWMVKANYGFTLSVHQLLRLSDAAKHFVGNAANLKNVGAITHIGYMLVYPDAFDTDDKALRIDAWTDERIATIKGWQWLTEEQKYINPVELDDMVNAVVADYAAFKAKVEAGAPVKAVKKDNSDGTEVVEDTVHLDIELFTRDKKWMDGYLENIH